MDKSNFFFCYNHALANYIQSKGITFITLAKHPVSNAKFALFYKDENNNLQQAIDDYRTQSTY